ncbi:MAG: cobalamin-binding protein [Myxococcales bacterium]|nr:cobalamin-binding protein [Myxococcales bacterium]
MRGLLVAGFALVLACGCTRREGPAGLRERKDGLGRMVRLPPPERALRIISLAPSSTEILFDLGAGPRVVGVDGYSDWPAEVKALPRVGANTDPNLERIVALRPDVVFTATSANTQRTVEAMERLGLPVYVSRADSLEEIYRDVIAIGEVVGRGAEAERRVADLRRRIALVGARRKVGSPRVKALVVVWSDPLMVAGRASHVGDLLLAAGGENMADDSPQPFPTYSLERVVARVPEVMVVGTHSSGSPPLAPLERTAALLGKRRYRIEMIDVDLLFRPGPRVVEGVEVLDRLLHPVGPAGGAK